VFRTKKNEPTTVFNVGRYLDRPVRVETQLRFREKVACSTAS
jgi:3-phenylpropionate/cinnamic acid dioxygenase small subunit